MTTTLLIAVALLVLAVALYVSASDHDEQSRLAIDLAKSESALAVSNARIEAMQKKIDDQKARRSQSEGAAAD